MRKLKENLNWIIAFTIVVICSFSLMALGFGFFAVILLGGFFLINSFVTKYYLGIGVGITAIVMGVFELFPTLKDVEINLFWWILLPLIIVLFFIQCISNVIKTDTHRKIMDPKQGK